MLLPVYNPGVHMHVVVLVDVAVQKLQEKLQSPSGTVIFRSDKGIIS